MTQCEICNRETKRRKSLKINETPYLLCKKCYTTIDENEKKGRKTRMKDLYYNQDTTQQSRNETK